MSLRLPANQTAGLFKNGYKSYSSADGAVGRNVEAVNEITNILLTSMGPCGKNKIIVNHLQNIFITNDCSTILGQLDVVHPIVKILIMATQQQKDEFGDNSNFLLNFASELLKNSLHLINLGLKPIEIIQGYNKAKNFILNDESINQILSIDKITNFLSKSQLTKIIKPVVASKQYGSEDFLANLIIDSVLNEYIIKNFNVDSIRVVKIMGSTLLNSFAIKGMVFPREPEGHVKSILNKSKVAVFTCPIDISATETKGTVLLHNAQEMLDFSKGEENQLDSIIKQIANTGIKVIIANQNIGELPLHYLNRYNILALRVPSKFDLRRICRVCGATPLARLGPPMPEEMGTIDIVQTKEIGGDRVTVFQQENDTSLTSTIVIRGATKNNLDDIERAIDDGISAIKGLTKDQNLCPGAGATETHLYHLLNQFGDNSSDILQLPIKQFAKSFEIIPRVLSDTAGLNTTEVLPKLFAKHSLVSNKKQAENDSENNNEADDGLFYGIDIENENGDGITDIRENGIYDLLCSKKNAISLATEAVNTILSVDQIIVAKRAGGPQMPQQPKPGNWDMAD
ncbi:chaperonin-containing T-complex subunit CCT8 [Ascoidea rubescens DSM 1968]|uniref:CCT-theta n=1 Tax=Ascoidea rubescens DSM 1968 TaxID=1344418 RepID=A0A1D2VF95_9ASCO|nr:T-complex protein 1 subunit theta [Ascoidea rubescens DSM 1968]ODV60358.1 T-complex protein 1 subunit theta [Ascoidea rubescens DSM 1968]